MTTDWDKEAAVVGQHRIAELAKRAFEEGRKPGLADLEIEREAWMAAQVRCIDEALEKGRQQGRSEAFEEASVIVEKEPYTGLYVQVEGHTGRANSVTNGRHFLDVLAEKIREKIK